MTATHKNRLVTTISAVASAGLGAFTVSTASSGYRTFGAGDDGLTFDGITITEGTAWERRDGCVYTHSGTSLSRGTLMDSSTGSAIAFTSAAVITQGGAAELAAMLQLAMASTVPGGRLTLESGVPVTTATNAVAVSGQDTVADTITVTAHGWRVGTLVTSSATSGGITAGTQYYAGNITTNTISLHTTVAAALAGTSKLDITGAVTATITASGVANTSIYYTPFVNNVVPLWDGYKWVPTEFTEKTLALGTLTSGKPYDVFGYLSAGALVLESLAWTDDTTRATAVTLQDGRYCKSGDKTRLLLGTFYTTSTTTTEDSNLARYVSNLYNQQPRAMTTGAITAPSHSYNGGAWREWNAGTSVVRLNWVQAGPCDAPILNVFSDTQAGGVASQVCYVSVYVDATSGDPSESVGNPTALLMRLGASKLSAAGNLAAGKHYATPAEYGNTGTGARLFAVYWLSGVING